MSFTLKSLSKTKSVKSSYEFREIVRIFFSQLVEVYLHHWPEATYSQAIYEIFGVDERPIDFYKVIKEFKLPGAYRLNSTATAQGYKNPYLKYGKILTVRQDSDKPNIVGIQVDDNKCFNLTRSEWKSIQHKVKKLD